MTELYRRGSLAGGKMNQTPENYACLQCASRLRSYEGAQMQLAGPRTCHSMPQNVWHQGRRDTSGHSKTYIQAIINSAKLYFFARINANIRRCGPLALTSFVVL